MTEIFTFSLTFQLNKKGIWWGVVVFNSCNSKVETLNHTQTTIPERSGFTQSVGFTQSFLVNSAVRDFQTRIGSFTVETLMKNNSAERSGNRNCGLNVECSQ